MKCKRLKLEDLQNEEWFQFNTEFKSLVEQYTTPAALGIEELFEKYKPLYADADEALELIKKSATTEQLAEADNARDFLLRGFNNHVSAALTHFSEQKRTAAKHVTIAIDAYGNMARQNYDKQTASIYNFLQEMKGDYARSISVLGMNEWITLLETSNQEFSALMQTRYNETEAKTSLRMKEVRVETDRCFRDILDRLDALMLINGSGQYESFVNSLNTRIERYSNIIAQRKGRAAAKKNKEEE